MGSNLIKFEGGVDWSGGGGYMPEEEGEATRDECGAKKREGSTSKELAQERG